VNGTPTFYINGTRYDDESWDEKTLVAAIKHTLTNSKHCPAKRKKKKTAVAS
jgi:hypothetical protein